LDAGASESGAENGMYAEGQALMLRSVYMPDLRGHAGGQNDHPDSNNRGIDASENRDTTHAESGQNEYLTSESGDGTQHLTFFSFLSKHLASRINIRLGSSFSGSTLVS
jgi:hypothetical protein